MREQKAPSHTHTQKEKKHTKGGFFLFEGFGGGGLLGFLFVCFGVVFFGREELFGDFWWVLLCFVSSRQSGDCLFLLLHCKS